MTHLIWPRGQPRLQPRADRCKMSSKKWHSTTLTVLLNFRADGGVSRCRRVGIVLETAFQLVYIRNPQFLVSQEIGNNGRYLGVGGGIRALIWRGKYKLVGTVDTELCSALSNAGAHFSRTRFATRFLTKIRHFHARETRCKLTEISHEFIYRYYRYYRYFTFTRYLRVAAHQSAAVDSHDWTI